MNAEQYRQEAALLRAKAGAEESQSVRTELENLADCYLQLAMQSEKRADTRERAAVRR